MRVTTTTDSSLILLMTLALVIVAMPAHSVLINDLYVAEVTTVSQSDAQRRRDAGTGLLDVLVRVSGRVDIVEHPLVTAALRTPENYYTEFSYQTIESGGSDAELSAPTLQKMQIRFEPSLISDLLRLAGLPVWGSNRPSVLFWVARGSGAERAVLGEGSSGVFAQSVRERAESRGVPVYFPVWDLEDSSRVTVSEIWGRFLDQIEAASERYSPDKLLVVRVEKRYAGQWHVDWSYGDQGEWRVGTLLKASETEAAIALVDEITALLSAQYAGTSARSALRLNVEGISGVAALAEVERYLQRLSSVLDVRLRRVKGDLLTFDVRSEGDLEQLIDLIALDRDLTLLSSDVGASTVWYRWSGEN